MKNDSKSCFPAEVDVSNARFSKGYELAIDFANEIDVWTQMEVRASHQIKHLKQYGSNKPAGIVKEQTYTLFYGTRQFTEN